jgi:hypothetical protein
MIEGVWKVSPRFPSHADFLSNQSIRVNTLLPLPDPSLLGQKKFFKGNELFGIKEDYHGKPP